MYEAELKISQLAAKKAGQYLIKEFHKIKHQNYSHKDRHEIVTKCDKGAEKIILNILNKNFPNYAFLSEEKGASKNISNYHWIIDPLDGTSNFVGHNPLFTVSIALAYKKKIVLGVIYQPILDEMYVAQSGKGAKINNKKILVSKTSQLAESFLTYCHGNSLKDHQLAFKAYEHFHQKARDCRHLGSTSLELALVASGHNDALLVSGTKIWDIAAGVLLVKEAGGLVTDWQGQPWTIDSANLLATNKKLHTKILSDLKKI
ncbi:MAG: inositol monophosphatase family protein [Patescibacteria group bacterium]|jgi:myo-inositol-1(or 4)-monophosphatase